MKRMIRALVAAAVLVSSLTVSAFAATDGYTTDVSGTVTCDGEALSFDLADIKSCTIKPVFDFSGASGKQE